LVTKDELFRDADVATIHIIAEGALIQALTSRSIAGAALGRFTVTRP
jgi:hypothetical protein